MTPSDITKQLTALLADALAPVGFRKKRAGWLLRRVGGREEAVAVSVTRRRGPPGDLYDAAVYLHLNYPAVNTLRNAFLPQKGSFSASTAALPLNALTGKPCLAYVWRAADPLEPLAEQLAADTARYGPLFWGRYDTLEKLAARLAAPDSEEHGCFFSGLPYERQACHAAALCVLGKRDALDRLLAQQDFPEAVRQLVRDRTRSM